jgi:putative transposase
VACPGHHARRADYERLTTRSASSPTGSWSDCPFRPGGQYIGQAYKKLLADAGAQWSQSRKAECLDNAQAESLWSRFKTEELAARPQPYCADLADARASVATYFDYYNYERRHSALVYRTPQSFYLQQLKNAP